VLGFEAQLGELVRLHHVGSRFVDIILVDPTGRRAALSDPDFHTRAELAHEIRDGTAIRPRDDRVLSDHSLHEEDGIGEQGDLGPDLAGGEFLVSVDSSSGGENQPRAIRIIDTMTAYVEHVLVHGSISFLCPVDRTLYPDSLLPAARRFFDLYLLPCRDSFDVLRAHGLE
jgi:hypothetical protein